MNRTNREWILALVLLGLCTAALHGQIRQGKFGVGLSGSGNILNSDLPVNQVGYGSSAALTYAVQDHWGFSSDIGFDMFLGKLSNGNEVSVPTFYGDLSFVYNIAPHRTFNPFIYVGGNLLTYYPREKTSAGYYDLLTGLNNVSWTVGIIGGFGFDYFLNEFWSVTASVQGGWLLSDNIDGIPLGGNDAFGRISIGVRYYLFDKSFVKELIETSKELVKKKE